MHYKGRLVDMPTDMVTACFAVDVTARLNGRQGSERVARKQRSIAEGTAEVAGIVYRVGVSLYISMNASRSRDGRGQVHSRSFVGAPSSTAGIFYRGQIVGEWNCACTKSNKSTAFNLL